jgi:cytoskeletal protein CcmA (bactofilin family)
MFSRAKSNSDAAAPKADARKQVPSIISASLRIVGNLVSAGDVQVDGIVDGDVKSRTLTISQGAAVNGSIEADSVYIQGEVNGQITAENVVLGVTARVVGDVVHSTLVIESGAFLEGHCRHLAVATVVEPQPSAVLVGDAPSDVESAVESEAAEAEAMEENTQPREATAA